jgi:hypothetical protein
MKSFAEKIISFYGNLDFKGSLPPGISVMNPFKVNPVILDVASKFYRKYYSDNHERFMILGINPGRFGAGVTGIPFTDTIRLKEKCGLTIKGLKTRETSSVFIYEMIDKYGGPEKFYSDFYISSVSPLGFISQTGKGKVINYNYYDSMELTDNLLDFILDSLYKQLAFGIKRDVCYCLGTGKNFKYLTMLNNQHKFFGKIVPLEHPRFIMQYRLKSKQFYIESYLNKLKPGAVPSCGKRDDVPR